MVEHSKEQPADRPDADALLRLLEEVAERRFRGEDISDEAVMASHPEFIPELATMLRDLRLAENARNEALASPAPNDRGSSSSSWGLSRDRPDPIIDRPDAIAGYELLNVVGRGGMGVVYRARHRTTKREVAIKVMRTGCFVEPMDQARFEREASILVSLRHPNIVTVYDTGLLPPPADVDSVGTIGGESADGRFYLVMDYVPGEPLDRFVTAREPDLRACLALFAKTCDAVNAAHLRGVIHRDLKPSNILVTPPDTSTTGREDEPHIGEPHLLDFGLATFTQPEDGDSRSFGVTMTMTGQFVGSLPWASPEQAEAIPGNIDLRTDVYSLGVILYHMLSGRFPYPVTGNIRDIVDNILTRDPQPLGGVAPRVDDEVETIVLKCLSKERARRYQSAGDVADDIRRYLSGAPVEAKRDSGWYVLRKGLRRHLAAVAVSTAFVVLIIAFGITMTVLYRQEQREANRARQALGFLSDVLFQASSHRLGSDATLSEMLDHASERVAADFAGLPESEALLRYTIGSAYETIWRKEEAVTHLRASLDLYRRTKGAKDPETLRCMVLLGMVLAELRDPQAVDLQREALNIRRERYGDNHELVAHSMAEYAFALWITQNPPQWSEAERYYERALALFRETVGHEHKDLARTLHAFGTMRRIQGRLMEAEDLYRQSLAMSLPLLGADHQFVAECRREYAVTLAGLGRFDEAETMMREVETRTRRLFGRASVAQVRYQLAEILFKKGDLPDARVMVEEALAERCRYLASAYPNHAERLRRVAAKLGHQEPAVASVIEEAIALSCEVTGELRRSVHFAELLADIAQQRDGAEAAEPILESSLRVADAWSENATGRLEQPPGHDSWYRGRVIARYGACLVDMGRLQEGLRHLESGCAILAAELGEDHAYAMPWIDALARARKKAAG